MRREDRRRPVITGYVDRVTESVSATAHALSISGRGKCEELVDCAAQLASFQFANMATADVAALLASANVCGEQRDYFRQMHLVPITVPRDQHVGDVYNTNNFSFVANAGICFPTLHEPAAMPTVFARSIWSGAWFARSELYGVTVGPRMIVKP
ncbi:hypothetical protein QF001_003088 [Paraburkholderia youngii]